MAGSLPDFNRTVFADNADRSLEILLAPYLTPASTPQPRLSEADVRQIATGLAHMGKGLWSRVPRIYAVLRMIDNVQVIDSFLSQGISDIWFPFSHKTLPESLRSASARFEFLRLQDAVLTKAFDLEREDGKHRHFSKSEDIPLQKLEELGKGGFGYVDRVLSTITYKEYARKLIPRGKTFKKNNEVLRDFERELSHLKKMSHIHIVELVGSYTDSRFVGILMSPVADYNLKAFLARDQLSQGERSFLRTFFGCLAAALSYLHENRIRHKDIKPQNVLVRGHQVFLTDFGISLDWSELDQSTTTGATIKTPRYCAPEVASFLPRNSLSDLWSLGCVFLEMWTVLKRETLDNLLAYLEQRGSNSTCYYQNFDVSLEWCKDLEQKRDTVEENPPLSWVRGMLEPDQERRWTAQTLVDRVQDTNDSRDVGFLFTGTCCIGSDDTTDSSRSSKRSSAILERTGASSIGVYIPRVGKVKSEEDTEVPASAPLISRVAHPSPMSESRNEAAVRIHEFTDATVSDPALPADQQMEQLLGPEIQACTPDEVTTQTEDIAPTSAGQSEGDVTCGPSSPETVMILPRSEVHVANSTEKEQSLEKALDGNPPSTYEAEFDTSVRDSTAQKVQELVDLSPSSSRAEHLSAKSPPETTTPEEQTIGEIQAKLEAGSLGARWLAGELNESTTLQSVGDRQEDKDRHNLDATSTSVGVHKSYPDLMRLLSQQNGKGGALSRAPVEERYSFENSDDGTTPLYIEYSKEAEKEHSMIQTDVLSTAEVQLMSMIPESVADYTYPAHQARWSTTPWRDFLAFVSAEATSPKALTPAPVELPDPSRHFSRTTATAKDGGLHLRNSKKAKKGFWSKVGDRLANPNYRQHPDRYRRSGSPNSDQATDGRSSS